MSTIRLTVNGKAYSVDAEPQTSLLTVLREQLDLTGSKYGCGEGQCGACTVLDRRQGAAVVRHRVGTVSQKQITTIEGLAKWRSPASRAEAFLEADGAAMRVLHVGDDHVGGGSTPEESGAEGKRNHRFHGRQRLPLRDVSAHCGCDSEGGEGGTSVGSAGKGAAR